MFFRRGLISILLILVFTFSVYADARIDYILKKGILPPDPGSASADTTKLNYILVGTFIADGKKVAFLFDRNSRKIVEAKLNDILSDRSKVIAIEKGKVTLLVGGRKVTLNMFSKEAREAAAYVSSKWAYVEKTEERATETSTNASHKTKGSRKTKTKPKNKASIPKVLKKSGSNESEKNIGQNVFLKIIEAIKRSKLQKQKK